MSRQSYRSSHAVFERFYNSNVFKCPQLSNLKARNTALCSEKHYKILHLSYCSNDALVNEYFSGHSLSHDKGPFTEYFKFPPV